MRTCIGQFFSPYMSFSGRFPPNPSSSAAKIFLNRVQPGFRTDSPGYQLARVSTKPTCLRNVRRMTCKHKLQVCSTVRRRRCWIDFQIITHQHVNAAFRERQHTVWRGRVEKKIAQNNRFADPRELNYLPERKQKADRVKKRTCARKVKKKMHAYLSSERTTRVEFADSACDIGRGRRNRGVGKSQ